MYYFKLFLYIQNYFIYRITFTRNFELYFNIVLNIVINILFNINFNKSAYMCIYRKSFSLITDRFKFKELIKI